MIFTNQFSNFWGQALKGIYKNISSNMKNVLVGLPMENEIFCKLYIFKLSIVLRAQRWTIQIFTITGALKTDPNVYSLRLYLHNVNKFEIFGELFTKVRMVSKINRKIILEVNFDQFQEINRENGGNFQESLPNRENFFQKFLWVLQKIC